MEIIQAAVALMPATYKIVIDKIKEIQHWWTIFYSTKHFIQAELLFPMNAYDSDSSAGDDSPYTETSVLLGYASKEPTDDTISHLGGHPV
jgi:hypothetical protein